MHILKYCVLRCIGLPGDRGENSQDSRYWGQKNILLEKLLWSGNQSNYIQANSVGTRFSKLFIDKILIMAKNVLLIIAVVILYSCSYQENRKINFALYKAGDNRHEIEKILDYYKNDPLKYQAATYLIENMPFHFTKDEFFLSPQNERYIPDITKFSDKYAVKRHCDSIKRCGYQLMSQIKYDISSLQSDYLIKNIELAFSLREKPWVKNISFDDFCRYVLPYRAQIEEPTSLRQDFMRRYLPLLDSVQPQNSLEACLIIHQQLRKEIRYLTTGSPLYPTTEETYNAGFGDCSGLCNLTIAIMRSVGIPVTIDHTTWTKMNLGHSWCSVLNEGRFYCFNPGETDPIEYGELLNNTYNRVPAKVYRDRFDPIPQTAKDNKTDDGYITFLKNVLTYDVTSEYLGKTIDIVNPVEKDYSNKSSIVYLCTFNCNEWQPIAIGEKAKNNYIFENVVGDNIFIIADVPQGQTLRFVSAPFYVDSIGAVKKLIPSHLKGIKYVFSKEKYKLFGRYNLYFWDVETASFMPVDECDKLQDAWIYENIPLNAMLLFYIPGANRNRSGFFIEQNEIKPWKKEIPTNC